MAIFLMGDAKKSLSSCQLARHLDLIQQSAWYMMKRIRSEMGRTGKTLGKQGIIEADEEPYPLAVKRAGEKTKMGIYLETPANGAEAQRKRRLSVLLNVAEKS